MIISVWSAGPISWLKASLPSTSLAAHVIQSPASAKSQIITGQEPSVRGEGLSLVNSRHHKCEI